MDTISVVKLRFSGIWGRLFWPAMLLQLSLLPISRPAMAQNLVQNSTFQVTGGTTSFQFGTFNGFTSSESLAGWASTGYNFVFLPGSPSGVGTFNGGNVSFNMVNGFTGASPTGGNFLALDSDTGSSNPGGTAPVTQTIHGLTAGTKYTLSFAWAGAQQTGFTGATTDNLTVSLGSSTQTTQTINVASQGFSGWLNQTFSFVATSSSEVLSFLAGGSPAVPPFVLLANVSLTAAPEPAGAAVLLTGLAALAGLTAKRRRRLAVPRMQGV